MAVLGTAVPEELVRAAGAVPRFLLGGSQKAQSWSDALVPRDTDPMSRSVFGFLHDPDNPAPADTLFLVPLTCDSMRKTAYLLTQEGRKVCTLDIRPQRGTGEAMEQWERQAFRMMEAVAAHTGTRVTAGRVRRAVVEADEARRALRDFLRVASWREDVLTCSARILVQHSYSYAQDMAEWTARLHALTEELRNVQTRPCGQDRPGILLTGSPVYFPNDKILFLMEDAGLSVLRYTDASTLSALTPPMDRRPLFRDALIRAAADRWLLHGGSSAYTRNEALYGNISGCVREGWAEGVVVHVLKGQIEYDFELDRLEALCDSVPLFRLETDYQYQDVEQLRIRMEAFSEMLVQNRLRREAAQRKTAALGTADLPVQNGANQGTGLEQIPHSVGSALGREREAA